MKELFLVRHAKSSWDQPSWADIDRPLNNRGVKAAYEMGRRTQERGLYPQLVISSPANRAIHTAIIMCRSIEYDLGEIEMIPNLFHADYRQLLNEVRKVNDEYSSVMLFAHNPGITEFANYIGQQSYGNVPTAGFLHFQFNVNRWSECETAEVLLFDYPKNPF